MSQYKLIDKSKMTLFSHKVLEFYIAIKGTRLL